MLYLWSDALCMRMYICFYLFAFRFFKKLRYMEITFKETAQSRVVKKHVFKKHSTCLKHVLNILNMCGGWLTASIHRPTTTKYQQTVKIWKGTPRTQAWVTHTDAMRYRASVLSRKHTLQSNNTYNTALRKFFPDCRVDYPQDKDLLQYRVPSFFTPKKLRETILRCIQHLLMF